MSKEIFLYSADNKYQAYVELADNTDRFGCPDHSFFKLIENRNDDKLYLIAEARDGLLETEKDQRITELEQELAKYKDLQDRLGLENVDELEWFVMLDLLTDNEKNMHILDLHRELAELKEKAIVPKFKVRQEVWWIDTRGNIYNKQNYKIDSYLIDSIVVTDNKFRYYGEDGCWLSEEDLFATEEEAQAKLKEIQGNE